MSPFHSRSYDTVVSIAIAAFKNDQKSIVTWTNLRRVRIYGHINLKPSTEVLEILRCSVGNVHRALQQPHIIRIPHLLRTEHRVKNAQKGAVERRFRSAQDRHRAGRAVVALADSDSQVQEVRLSAAASSGAHATCGASDSAKRLRRPQRIRLSYLPPRSAISSLRMSTDAQEPKRLAGLYGAKKMAEEG
eukprot:scaffold48_cov311-Pinguiococcus_pyrenoidosus.AAC.148